MSIDVLLTWTTSRFTAIKVRHAPRAAGVSGYTVGKLVRHAINLMTGFSTLPLQVASVLGFVFVLFGLLILLFVVANYLIRGSAVPGFAFLASIITIFSGAQLFALGIFGEYLARMHFRSMDRPAYVIGDIVALPNSDGSDAQPAHVETENVFSYVEERLECPGLDLVYHTRSLGSTGSSAATPPPSRRFVERI